MHARLSVALATLIALASTALATPREDLASANKAFREGQFLEARDKYNYLLYPKAQLADTNDLVEAYVNLGVCRLETGDDDGAKSEFEKALELDPNKQLDPLVITNKRAIVLFDDTKADIRTRREREANARREAAEAERLRKLKESLITVRDNPYYLTFVPFGVGQFQNKEVPKGLFFLGAELVTVGTSISIWGYLVNKYGIRSDQVPLDEGPRVRRLQQIEIGTGIAFFGLYLWGVIDANLHYKRQVRTELDESLLPEELRTKPKKRPKKTSVLERIHISPMITPDGAGIGLGWEND